MAKKLRIRKADKKVLLEFCKNIYPRIYRPRYQEGKRKGQFLGVTAIVSGEQLIQKIKEKPGIIWDDATQTWVVPKPKEFYTVVLQEVQNTVEDWMIKKVERAIGPITTDMLNGFAREYIEMALEGEKAHEKIMVDYENFKQSLLKTGDHEA